MYTMVVDASGQHHMRSLVCHQVLLNFSPAWQAADLLAATMNSCWMPVVVWHAVVSCNAECDAIWDTIWAHLMYVHQAFNP